MRPRLLAPALAALLVAAAFAGCATTVDSDGVPSGGSQAGGATPTMPTGAGAASPGHALARSTFSAASVSLTGVSESLTLRDATMRLAPNVTSLADHRAILVYGARVGADDGILVALPGDGDVRFAGELRLRADTTTVTPREVRHLAARDPSRSTFVPAALDEPMRNASFDKDAFFGTALALGATRALEVRAERLVLVTSSGARELGGRATLDAAGTFVATAGAELVRPAVAGALEVADRRGHLALDGAAGTLRFDDGTRALPIDGAGLVTLAKGGRVEVTPRADRVDVAVTGRAFQAYADGKAHLRSALAMEVDTTRFALADGETRATRFRLVASDPDADPVITAIRIDGAPDGAVALPGFVPLTGQVLESFGGDPFGTLVVAPALPALIVMDAFLAVLDALLGPARITQSLEAGTTFHSELRVRGASEPYTATLVIEGNFEPVRVTLHVEP